MKTYEEMAQSVLRRAKAHRTARNRWIAGSVAAVLALCVCVGVTVMNRPDEDVTVQTPPATETPSQTVIPVGPAQDSALQTLPVPSGEAAGEARVTFLYSDGSPLTGMEPDVDSPCRMEIRVKDITGLSQEEVDALCEAEKQYADALIAANPQAKGYHWTQTPRTNKVVTCISAGHFIIGMTDPEQIESIYATVQGAVQLNFIDFATDWDDPSLPMPKEYFMSHEQIMDQYYYPHRGVQINWDLSNETIQALDQGSVALGELRDTITFTVTYVDGTVENHAIDMIFNESGEVYALYRGAATVA